MTDHYRVVGGCEVAGAPNGTLVSAKALEAAGANVPALLYAGHLEEADDAVQQPRGKKVKDVDGGGG